MNKFAWVLATTAILAALEGSVFGQEKIVGAGVSSPARLFAQWVSAYNTSQADGVVAYQSTGNRQPSLAEGTAHFWVTDVPLEVDELPHEKDARMVFASTPPAMLPIISGTGASFPAPVYARWVDAFRRTRPEFTVEYTSTGSGSGIASITNRTAFFGASDSPLTAAQEKAAPAPLIHIPTVGGSLAIVHNIKGLKSLKLTGPLLADIYLGNIRKWNAPPIAALNPGINIPDSPIVTVHRADGSGTNLVFTDFLSKVSDDWKQKVGSGTTVDWPRGINASKSEGIAGTVWNTENSVAYAEHALAKATNLPIVNLVNAQGKEVEPSIKGMLAAAEANLRDGIPEDLKLSITNAPGADSYPLAGYSYFLVYQDLSYLKNKAQALRLVTFLKWCLTDGQEMAQGLGYAPLTKPLREAAIAKLNTITFDGAILMP